MFLNLTNTIIMISGRARIIEKVLDRAKQWQGIQEFEPGFRISQSQDVLRIHPIVLCQAQPEAPEPAKPGPPEPGRAGPIKRLGEG